MNALRDKLPLLVVVAFLGGGIAVVIANALSGPDPLRHQVSVTVPPLSEQAKAGKAVFEENCASCHGKNAAGGETGPPLVHDIYNPGHHADAAFFMAVRNGVRAHHWRFGNMPPVPAVSERQVADIVRYVRELQVANGIAAKPHRM